MDPNDLFDDEVTLDWSLKYVVICLLLPTLHGCLNGYHFSCMTLHYLDMGWPIARAGLPSAIGYGLRLIVQQIQLRAGFWSVIPLQILHLAAAVLGLIYGHQEWGVVVEIAAVMGLDPGITIEGLCFDAFAASEDIARQASCTLLAIFTIFCALGVTAGGVLYDSFGWQGASAFHVGGQALLVITLLCQKACWQSFYKFIHGAKETEEEEEEAEKEEEEKEVEAPKVEPKPAPQVSEAAEWAMVVPGAVHSEEDVVEGDGPQIPPRRPRQSYQSRVSLRTAATGNTHRTRATAMTRQTGRTAMTRGTNATMGTMLSRITALKDNDTFQHHFGASGVLRPAIAEKNGVQHPEPEEKTKGIPKDFRWPAFLIAMVCLNNQFCYAMEYQLFAIFFRKQHGWSEATWASLAQTAGDLVAAVLMKLPIGQSEDGELSKFRQSFMQPYNVSWLLLLWIICNGGMAMPWLPLAVTAQVIMGTGFVYSTKASTDLNLYYSMGDTEVFLMMQVYCKNVEAIGGIGAMLVGTFLYDQVDPLAPWIAGSLVSLAAFSLFTTGFCRRLGLRDIEEAEAIRARRLGIKRVSHWSVVSRKTKVLDDDLDLDAEEPGSLKV